jgi:hypothetical protein
MNTAASPEIHHAQHLGFMLSILPRTVGSRSLFYTGANRSDAHVAV